MSLKSKIIHYLNNIIILLNTPEAFNAYRTGCKLSLYEMIYRLKSMGFQTNTIIDVGAYTGMFAKCSNRIFPEATIHAFEPLKDCYTELQKLKLSINRLNCYNVALGKEKEETLIHRSSFPGSSSILAMDDRHKTTFPETSEEQLVNVSVFPLDEILDYNKLVKPVLMKIDVQGYEKHVIQGAQETLKRTDIIIVEMSFKQLYEGQVFFGELYNMLEEMGFNFAGPIGELLDPVTSEILQIDGLFIKSS